MKIDLTKIIKETLIICITEEIERDEFTANTFARQVKNHQTYGKQEEFEQALQKYKNKIQYFNTLRNNIHNIDVIEEENTEVIKFWEDLIENQIYYSSERIKDWSVGGDMYNPENSKNKEKFEQNCKNIIDFNNGQIECMSKIGLMFK